MRLHLQCFSALPRLWWGWSRKLPWWFRKLWKSSLCIHTSSEYLGLWHSAEPMSLQSFCINCTAAGPCKGQGSAFSCSLRIGILRGNHQNGWRRFLVWWAYSLVGCRLHRHFCLPAIGNQVQFSYTNLPISRPHYVRKTENRWNKLNVYEIIKFLYIFVPELYTKILSYISTICATAFWDGVESCSGHQFFKSCTKEYSSLSLLRSKYEDSLFGCSYTWQWYWFVSDWKTWSINKLWQFFERPGEIED